MHNVLNSDSLLLTLREIAPCAKILWKTYIKNCTVICMLNNDDKWQTKL